MLLYRQQFIADATLSMPRAYLEVVYGPASLDVAGANLPGSAGPLGNLGDCPT